MTMPHDVRPDDSHDESSLEPIDTLRRLAARLAFMERVGLFGFGQSSTGLGGNTSLKNACHSPLPPDATDASQCPPDLSNFGILNHALNLESLEPEFNVCPSAEPPVPAIRVAIGATEFGVSSPPSAQLQCRVTLHIEYNSHEMRSKSALPWFTAMALHARRKVARVSRRPRVSWSQDHKKRPSKLPVPHHPRSSPEDSCRHPRRRRSPSPGNGSRG